MRATHQMQNMRITFQPKPRDQTRLMIPISEFNPVVFRIQVRHVFPRVPNTTRSPNQPRNRPRCGLRRVCL
jgi:hypothetical protein